MYRSVEEIDWEAWEPVVRATLLFVVRDGHLLLMHKKRGFGKGKVNGPGGKIEPGETPLECAIRETREELCITPTGVAEAGQLRFQFTDGHSIRGHVFTATGCEGEPAETDEGAPLWRRIDDLPFDCMWEDDPTWFPYMLEGRPFSGRYLFAGDRMLDAVIDPL